MDDKSTFGLSSDQLTRLMNIGTDRVSEHKELDGDDAKAQLLYDRITGTLPLDPALISLLPIILGRLCREILPMGGESISNLLLNPKTELSVIKKIKDYGKDLASSADSEIERATATVIYYTAIASSLVFHNQRITEYSYKDLAQSFSMLAEKKWVIADFVKLFKKAKTFCNKKT
jgi:hypothetical protein